MDIKYHELLGGSLNIFVLSTFYTIIGVVLSVFLFHVFDDCDDTWKSETLIYQLGDIFLELGIIGAVAFWTTRLINGYAPIFSISLKLDHQIDNYVSGIFFAFAMFLFLGELSLKIKYLYQTYISQQIIRFIPENWSVMKMLFGTVKTNTKTSSH